jgi:hypothetical protein
MSYYRDYPLSADTTPEAEAFLFQLLAKKSPAEKLQMVGRMNASVRELAMSGLRERHPQDSELQLKIRLAELLYGKQLADAIAQRLNHSQSNESRAT